MSPRLTPLEEFHSRVEDYLKRTGLAASSFGQLAVNDSSFVEDLRAGREPRFSTIGRVDQFMTEHPDGPAKLLKMAG